MKIAEINNLSNPSTKPLRIRVCDNFLTKLRGFTFKSTLNDEEGLVLVNENESRLDSAIHMLFVFFDLGIIWLNADMVVIEKRTAKKWTSVMIPGKPAKFVLEVHPHRLQDFNAGDKIEIN